MASQKQLAANRANAKRSTGPKSPTGKAASRVNARRHGLTAETIVIGNEDPNQFRFLRAALEEEFRPLPGLEEELIDRMAGQLWRLRRAPAIEAATIETHRAKAPGQHAIDLTRSKEWQEHLRQAYGPSAKYPTDRPRSPEMKHIIKVVKRMAAKEAAKKPTPAEQLRSVGLALIRDSEQHDTLGKLSRYEAAHMNGFTKTLQMLLWLQDKGLGMGNHEDPREHPNRTTDPESNNRKTRKPSFKRGLTAEAIVIATEDPLQFDLLRATVEQQFSPRPGVEQELVDRLAGLLWRLRRAPTLEAAVIQARDAQQTEANKVPAPDGPEGNLGLAIIKDSEQDTLGKLCRYENALMNAMAKTAHLLLLLQRQRAATRNPGRGLDPVMVAATEAGQDAPLAGTQSSS